MKTSIKSNENKHMVFSKCIEANSVSFGKKILEIETDNIVVKFRGLLLKTTDTSDTISCYYVEQCSMNLMNISSLSKLYFRNKSNTLILYT